jgi:hypothetical protein
MNFEEAVERYDYVKERLEWLDYVEKQLEDDSSNIREFKDFSIYDR